MSDDTLINTLDFITHLPDGRNHIEFHSVEPTLQGLPFFIRAQELIDEFGIDAKCLLASNMTSNEWYNNIDDWCQFLSDNDWVMNVSLDGPQQVHDKNRGEGTWERVIESLIKIKEYNIDYGIISVVKDGKDLNDIYNFFVDINENIQLNPTLPFNNMTTELCDLFDCWIADLKPISIEPFSKLFKYFTNQPYIKECPNICTHNLVSIDPSGYVRPCGFFWDNTDLCKEHIYGNVNNDSFRDIWYGEERQKMIEYVDCIPDDCMTCRYINFCGTGCSYAKQRGADKCSYIRSLLDYTCWLEDN